MTNRKASAVIANETMLHLHDKAANKGWKDGPTAAELDGTFSKSKRPMKKPEPEPSSRHPPANTKIGYENPKGGIH